MRSPCELKSIALEASLRYLNDKKYLWWKKRMVLRSIQDVMFQLGAVEANLRKPRFRVFRHEYSRHRIIRMAHRTKQIPIDIGECYDLCREGCF